MRARPCRRRTRLASRVLPAMPTTYSTPAEHGRGEGRPELGEQAAQQADSAGRDGGGPWPQQGGHQILAGLVVERQRGEQRQIAPGPVVPIEQGELLLAVGGILGGVQVQGDASDTLPLEAV